MDLAAQLTAAVVAALHRHGCFANEDGRASDEARPDFQTALVESLGTDKCEREVPIAFEPAAIPPPPPPLELGSAKDVCDKGQRDRSLDILWRAGDRAVAVEVKLRRITGWCGDHPDGRRLLPRKPVDTCGYYVLKDIHRLERLRSAMSVSGAVVPTDRFVLFLTNDPYEYEARVPHANLKLTPGRVLLPGHLAQYNLTKSGGAPTSSGTLWRDYPPFRLANRYEVLWREMADDVSGFRPRPPTTAAYPSSRLLLLRVEPQAGRSE